MNKAMLLILAAALVFVGLNSVFIVTETEYAIKFQLGRVVKADYEPGLHVKAPFINNVRKFDRRILTLDTQPEHMITSEQKFVIVDTFIKWRIADVAQFYISTQGNERNALNRLDSIVKDRIRNQIASRTLAQVVSEQRVTTMQDIQVGAGVAAEEFGVEIVDVRIKAVELPEDVRESVFQRMAADRQKDANRYRFEGREEAERIRADADRQVQVILADAEKEGQTLRGEADAIATRIYAEAYEQDEEFYAFYRSLQAYGNSFGGSQDVLVIDPSSSFFDYFGSDTARQQ